MTALVQAEELAALLGSDHPPVVLDTTVALTPDAEPGQTRFERGHIPGARYADLSGRLSRHDRPFHFAMPDPEHLVAELAALGVGRTTEVVVYDDDRSFWAARLWWMLRAIGHESVRVLDGGLARWRAMGGPVATGPDPARAANATDPIEPTLSGRRWFVDRSWVERWTTEPDGTVLVCALGADVFAAATPGRYTRSGHIPGSLNVPAAGLLDDDGRLAERSALRTHFADVLAPDPERPDAGPRPVVLYCGGGISACLDALALHELGHHDVSIYDGSLEEWSADPLLPLVGGVDEVAG
jgi:thiosulfate/3-mercaptopyruvate sulfurtransferase